MAGSELRTKLPLDTFARFAGIDPLHFNQVSLGARPDQEAICQSVYFQHEWQDVDRDGREAIARAIREAEGQLEAHLGYRLLPSWEVDEWRGSTPYFGPERINLTTRNARGFQQAVEAKWGYFVTGGREAKAVVEAARPITYTDEDGDGYAEKAVVTATVAAGQDACELALFYPVSGVVDDAGDDRWEIRPVKVSVSGTTATFVFRREQAVDAAAITENDPEAVLGTDAPGAGTFLQTVDVWRRYNDPSQQAHLLWEPVGTCGICADGTCQTCALATQAACLHPRGDPRLSILAYTPGTYDATTSTFSVVEASVGRQPEAVRLWYRAGWRDNAQACPMRDMDPAWARTVAILAASKLERPPCECRAVGNFIARWQEDLAYSGGVEQTALYSVSARALDNPFGTRRGEVYAWRRVEEFGAAIGYAANVG